MLHRVIRIQRYNAFSFLMIITLLVPFRHLPVVSVVHMLPSYTNILDYTLISSNHIRKPSQMNFSNWFVLIFGKPSLLHNRLRPSFGTQWIICPKPTWCRNRGREICSTNRLVENIYWIEPFYEYWQFYCIIFPSFAWLKCKKSIWICK